VVRYLTSDKVAFYCIVNFEGLEDGLDDGLYGCMRGIRAMSAVGRRHR
jgi:hypothetical protein